MSGDKLVYDLSEEIEGSPNVFIRKDWLNILDNMNQNYSSNQSILDTSQLSNSNKYLSYRESYLIAPMLLTLGTSANTNFKPATTTTSADYAIGLKNWFGNIIHSFTLDMNGTTIIQQTPFVNMYNTFKLMTTLSWGDVITQGSTIGFYPDDPLAFSINATAQINGIGICNNVNIITGSGISQANLNTTFNSYASVAGNVGFTRRQQYINFDLDAVAGTGGSAYSTIFPLAATTGLWKSFIFNKVNTAGAGGLIEFAITATIYLKHIHSFFSMVPLLKGTFFKMTMNLNNCSTEIVASGSATTPSATSALTYQNTAVAVGGVLPLMVASSSVNAGGFTITGVNATGAAATYFATLSVGSACLHQPTRSLGGYSDAPLGKSVTLYVPAYTFNPVFEQAYLSSPIKKIVYEDIYQYQVVNVGANSPFNNLITNGIANIKSVLIIPFYSASASNLTGSYVQGLPVYQSPFDTAGCGATSPFCLFSNFNVVISGQNAIYNTERYAFEHFNNQLMGQNAVNGGMTDGLTSSLVSSLGFEMAQSYYYTNVSRMLPVEESVPKSVQIIGQNLSGRALDLWVFITYGVSIDCDVLTGARV
jgi:hypothetical protein